MNQLHWLDTAKGLGIVAVVAGHVFSSRQLVDPIYLWHMPLFFFLSGYLFYPQPGKAFALRKIQHLLVPYVTFLLVISLPALWTGDRKHLLRMLFGGRALVASYGTFWFVPVLFVTQQLANFALPRLHPSRQAVLMAVCVAIALLIPAARLVPWALDVVLVALPIFWIGYRSKGQALNSSWISVLGFAGMALCGVGLLPTIDMKNGLYGWPIVSLLFSMSAVHLICQVSQWSMPCTGAFQALGRASMTIMFLHPALFMLLRDDLRLVSNEGLLFLIALTVPFAAHHLLARAKLTRRLFLGETRRPAAKEADSSQVQSRQSA